MIDLNNIKTLDMEQVTIPTETTYNITETGKYIIHIISHMTYGSNTQDVNINFGEGEVYICTVPGNSAITDGRKFLVEKTENNTIYVKTDYLTTIVQITKMGF